MAFWPRVFRNFRSEPTWKKNFLANVIRLQSSRKCDGRKAIYLYFDPMKELGHQGWFQRIYSVSCFGDGWNTVLPFVTLNSRNTNDANSPKSLRIGLKSWQMTKNTRRNRVSWLYWQNTVIFYHFTQIRCIPIEILIIQRFSDSELGLPVPHLKALPASDGRGCQGFSLCFFSTLWGVIN